MILRFHYQKQKSLKLFAFDFEVNFYKEKLHI